MAERALLRSRVQSTDRCVDDKESEEGPPAFLVQLGEAIELVARDTSLVFTGSRDNDTSVGGKMVRKPKASRERQE